MRVIKFSHHFLVYVSGRDEQMVVGKFRRSTQKWEWAKDPYTKRFTNVLKEQYSCYDNHRGCYMFHINQLDDFVKSANGYGHFFAMEETPISEGVDIDIRVINDFVLRPNQEIVFPYLTDGNKSNRAKLVTLQPGDGKGFLASKVIEHIHKRTAFIFRPQWIDKWAKELYSYFGLSVDDFYVISGLESILELSLMLQMGHPGFKIYLISNKTFQIYLKKYQENGDLTKLGYFANPYNFFEALGVGIRITDETHLDLHLNYMIDLFTNVDLSVGLSGSFESNDDFVTKIHYIMYPGHKRGPKVPIRRYLHVNSYGYRIDDTNKAKSRIQTTAYNDIRYSQIFFENSILRNKYFLNSYIGFINYIYIRDFLKVRQPGDKVRIYACLKEMCTKITEALQKLHPDEDIVRYVSTLGDPYTHLIDSSTAVTTPGSGGTGHDIKNLVLVIDTTNQDSRAGNKQVSGRCREIPTRQVTYSYLYSKDIEKQHNYHLNRLKTLEASTEKYVENDLPFVMK